MKTSMTFDEVQVVAEGKVQVSTNGTMAGLPLLVSVFTPLSAAGNPFIEETFESLKSQTCARWEWVILPNHGGVVPPHIEADHRVRVITGEDLPPRVGALKRAAAMACSGEWLVELDHDDVLGSNALERVARSTSDFVYSDFAEFRSGTNAPNAYDQTYGWESYSVPFRGRWLLAMVAPSNPLDWRRILWAPNHLRAWRRSTYEQVGGHDPSLEFADDQDLVLRTYLSGAECARIPECLYFYRVHDNQNVKLNNSKIQALAGATYDRYVYQLAEEAARDRSLPLIDLCGAHGCPSHYEPLDITLGHDLNGRWPLEDSSVGVIRAFDAIEHLKDPVHTMNEAWRVLAPGGVLLVSVPSADGKGAFCDPTHVSFWNDLSFRYYTDDRFRKYVPGIKARFALAGIKTIPIQVESAGGGVETIPYVKAELIALKDGCRPMGEIRC